MRLTARPMYSLPELARKFVMRARKVPVTDAVNSTISKLLSYDNDDWTIAPEGLRTSRSRSVLVVLLAVPGLRAQTRTTRTFCPAEALKDCVNGKPLVPPGFVKNQDCLLVSTLSAAAICTEPTPSRSLSRLGARHLLLEVEQALQGGMIQLLDDRSSEQRIGLGRVRRRHRRTEVPFAVVSTIHPSATRSARSASAVA